MKWFWGLNFPLRLALALALLVAIIAFAVGIVCGGYVLLNWVNEQWGRYAVLAVILTCFLVLLAVSIALTPSEDDWSYW